ncbi:hypothetical protein F6X40_34575 [Paraburkholderia sp. UCT31]|uniref:hypothetical protein n=1 Tax=Paraburkholderia sp. UCT31 TaxID=2615209 RepID=UPI0016562541|nr:hypothetical protein [Paraburkholderia sp. UCT31]MBC8741689.1 hypothetical protein [Paraburkholderia sp. UCT31]
MTPSDKSEVLRRQLFGRPRRAGTASPHAATFAPEEIDRALQRFEDGIREGAGDETNDAREVVRAMLAGIAVDGYPAAWLHILTKPGRRAEYASVSDDEEPDDIRSWVGQGAMHQKRPLFDNPAIVSPALTERVIEAMAFNIAEQVRTQVVRAMSSDSEFQAGVRYIAQQVISDMAGAAGESDDSTNEPVEMALCGPSQVFLKPNQSYRFYVHEGCAACEAAARAAEGLLPDIAQESDSEANAAPRMERFESLVQRFQVLADTRGCTKTNSFTVTLEKPKWYGWQLALGGYDVPEWPRHLELGRFGTFDELLDAFENKVVEAETVLAALDGGARSADEH